jgi:hypothetical protein
MNDLTKQTNIFAMFQKNPNCYYPKIQIDFTDMKDHIASNTKG